MPHSLSSVPSAVGNGNGSRHVEAVPAAFGFSVGTSPACIPDSTTFVPLPRRYSPEVTPPASGLIAACCVVAPVPPLATLSVPVANIGNTHDRWVRIRASEVSARRAAWGNAGDRDITSRR